MQDTSYDTQEEILPAVPQAPQLQPPVLPEPSEPELNWFGRRRAIKYLHYDPVAEQHRREETQFWKQQEFAKYQLHQRETLAKDFNTTASNFLAQQRELNKARTELAVQKSISPQGPPELYAVQMQNIADMQTALNFTKSVAMSQYSGIREIDNSMGPMIANFKPPRGAFGGGSGEGGGEEQPQMPQVPPSGGRYEMPGYSSPGEPMGTEPSGPVNDQMAMTEKVPSQEGKQAFDQSLDQAMAQQPPSPTDQWKRILESPNVGFPQGKGRVLDGRLTYYAKSSQQAKDWREALKSVEEAIPGVLNAPVDIVDIEENQKKAEDFYKWNAAQARMEMGKADFWKNLEQINPKEADLREMYMLAQKNNDDERAAGLLLLLNARIEDRMGLMRGLAERHENVLLQHQLDMATERPILNQQVRDRLERSGIEIRSEIQPGAPVKTSQTVTEFGRAFAEAQGGAEKGWDYNNLTKQQKELIVERWRAAAKRQLGQ